MVYADERKPHVRIEDDTRPGYSVSLTLAEAERACCCGEG
jgi:hypothetical protein